MRKSLVISVLCLCSLTNAVPLGLKKNMAIVQEQKDPMVMMAEDEETRPEMMISRLNLPSNATSIRADITDGFSCDNKTYGYYADVDNECQIFHVCLPVTYADGKENTFRWSFICPEETVFSQEYFTCMRSEDMSIDCAESFKYYELNRNFGMIEPEEVPADETEDEMNMADMPNMVQADQEMNKPMESAPVKKQTNKVQSNPNRRKTQGNRVAIEAQRKKVQPLRRLPKPAIVATTTVKPVEEEAPVQEPEVERTTLKYQRLTKRPIIPETPKPEEPKPEKEMVRQELFAQKRKRPQIFFPSRYDAAVQTEEAEVKPLKSEVSVQSMPEPVEPAVQSPAESQAQASEIKEVSIKPQMEMESVKPEKIEPMPVQTKEPAVVFIPVTEEEEEEPITELKSDVAPMPDNVPSRVEVVEIPIQKVDEPVVAEGSALLTKTPESAIPEEPKPAADSMEPIKGDEDEIPTDDVILKKIVSQIQKATETMKPKDEEKTIQDPVVEPEVVKSSELPKPMEPVNMVETMISEKEKIEEPLAESMPEMQVKFETSASEKKPEEPIADVKPAEEVKEETTMGLKVNVPAAEEPKPEPELLKDLPKPLEMQNSMPETPVLESEMQPSEMELSEMQPSETQPSEMLVKSEMNAEPLAAEAPMPEKDMALKIETPVPEMPLPVEVPTPEMNMQQTAAQEPMNNEEKQAEAEKPSSNAEMMKNEDAKIDLPVPIEPKPLESLSEPMKEESSMPKDVEVEKPIENKMPETEMNGEKVIGQPASDNEDAQALILDFISSLVNSENSNYDEHSALPNEMTSDSLPEASSPEQVVAEAEPVEIQTQDKEVDPLFIPVVPDSEQMYQIPVQVIESPEPQPAAPMPAMPEPKLPLTVDDVVELVKESLDSTKKKENMEQEQPSNDEDSPQPESDEVKPIYHRYVELGSNLLKSEALTASDDEPVVSTSENEKTTEMKKEESSPELPKITSETLSQPEELASKPLDSVPEVPAVKSEPVVIEETLPLEENLKEGRSLNRFRMDPRKRRFLFRSDAS